MLRVPFLRLTFAGVGGRVGPPGIPVEAGLAPLTLAPVGVVKTVAHASAALAGLAPRRPIEAAAQGVAAALALWRGTERTLTCQVQGGSFFFFSNFTIATGPKNGG